MATNLEFLKATSTSTNVASLSVEDVFSSEYDIYKVVYKVNEVGTELATETRLLNASGAVTSSNYDHAYYFMQEGGGTYSDGSDTGNDKWQYTMYNEGSVGGFFVMYVHQPSNSSEYTFASWNTSTHYLASSTSIIMARRGIGVLKVAEAHTGIQVYAGSSNITNAKLAVYGVK